MGNYEHSYLGPYLEYSVPVVEVTENRCHDRACPQPTAGFCQKCGMRAADRLYTIRGTGQIGQEVWEEGERLVPGCEDKEIGGRVHVYLEPNEGGDEADKHCRRWDKYDHPCGATPISPEEIEAGIAWFKAEFAEEIEALRAAVGAGPGAVDVRWGRLLSYW